MKDRFAQAAREARAALILALLYALFWFGCSFLAPLSTTILGMPLWFALSCLFGPLFFCLLCFLMIRFLFADLPLEDEQ